MKKKLVWAHALFALSLGCRNTPGTQPTANPSGPVSWREAAPIQPGSATLPCGGIGGIAANPAAYSWAYIEPKNACQLHTLPLNNTKPQELPLGPIRDCGLISEVGDVTASPGGAESPAFFYLLGSLSVNKIVDESGSVSFDSGTANLLFQLDPAGVPRSVDIGETLRAAILVELRRWNSELEKSGLQIEQDRKALILGGLAATPDGDFLLSLRAPRVCPVDASKRAECRAILMLVGDLAELFPKDNVPPERPEVKAHATIYLGGQGATSLEYEPLSEGYLVTSAESSKGYLLRFQPGLTSVSLRPIPIAPVADAKLRALVPAPGGAAALFTQDVEGCPASKLSWLPLPLEQLDGVDRTAPPE